MTRRCSCPPVDAGGSAFVGYRFPPEVIILAVRWYLRFGLSYRDLEELLAERGVEVDHVTLFRWVQRFTPLFVDAARPCRHAVGTRWFVDETYVKVSGRWRYVYRAVDEHGQVIDVYISRRRDRVAARRFFAAAITAHGQPAEVVTDLAPALVSVIEELLPDVFHNTDQYVNNRVECDHGRLKARLRR
jgi:transposase-like protein